MGDRAARHRQLFQLFLLKPSHYDDDGYVIQWARSDIPSNSTAALNAIAHDCRERRVLGDDVDIGVTVVDETNCRVKLQSIIRAIAATGGKGLVALVGVQSNQFPRAVDIARPLRKAGIPVCIGGFHTAGSLAMLSDPPAEIQQVWDLGISIFAGEAEGRLEEVLQDAYQGTLKSLYNYTADLPGLEGVPTPFLPVSTVKRNLSRRSSFDAGRGCPFQCSFCTIINVQGRKSRYRSADDIEQIIRENYAQGIRRFFITDDNFARNRNWEQIFDRLIRLRKREGLALNLIIQVDTLCHRIPDFIRKARRAGVKRVFIGLESIQPDNLIASKKKQNRVSEYRSMLQAWKAARVITYCGYIIGFPNDTPARVMRDIEIIKRELPVDLLEFFCLTPLPGSEDHQILSRDGVWMDPDLNNYDLEHVTTAHPLMSADEWRWTYRRAWDAFYTPDHVETIMRRSVASRISSHKIFILALWFYGSIVIEGVHPLQAGVFRRKYRTDRRPGLPLEKSLVFYSRYAWECTVKVVRAVMLALKYYRLHRRVNADPQANAYTDLALTPVAENEAEELALSRVANSAQRGTVQGWRQKTSPVPTDYQGKGVRHAH